ncbi:MAG TPA: hypothetical protein VGI78_02325 [Acetobacteraceae bacterium]|jgi:hypothetical protein
MSDTQHQIQPNALLSVSLPAARWNTVLMLLETAVGSLISDIQQQCLRQSQPAMQPMPARGNGADPERPEARE